MSRRLRWAALGAGILFVFWPLFAQPLILEDIGLFRFLHLFQTETFPKACASLLDRCMLPVYFRPLAAPLLWALFQLFGDAAFPYRLVMALLHWATAYALFRCARRIIGSDGPAFLAASLYAFSWLHWSGLTLVAGVAQSCSDLWFWAALSAALERPGLGIPMALATASVLFKEHAIVLPLFLAAAWPPARPDRLGPWTWIAWAGWAGVYIAARALLPGSFLDSPDPYAFHWPGLTAIPGYVLAWNMIWRPFTHLMPDMASLRAPWASLSAALAWSAAAAALAAALGGTARDSAQDCLTKEPGPRLRPALGFAALGFICGLLPYAAFSDALSADSISRFTLAWGALSIGLGALLAAGLRLLPSGWRKLGPGICLAGFAWLFLKAAIDFRSPDASLPPFGRWPIMRETRQTMQALQGLTAGKMRPHDRLLFVDFPPVTRLPLLFSLSAPRPVHIGTAELAAASASGSGPWDWRIQRRQYPERICVSARRSLDPKPRSYCWPR
ncbi:MAG: hypothetical protein WC881_07385 [Elusimicrobiota bacterium]|jgi:hypothetical protein